MSKLIRLWNEQTDEEKKQFQKLMKEDLSQIEFWETHKIVGDSEAGTSFVVPMITYKFHSDKTGGCTRVGTSGDCLSSELCSYCDNPPKRFRKHSPTVNDSMSDLGHCWVFPLAYDLYETAYCVCDLCGVTSEEKECEQSCKGKI